MAVSERDLKDEALRRLYDWWCTSKGPRIAPSRREFDPAAFSDLLPRVYLADVAHNPLRFRYRLFGTGVREDFGEDVTGKWLSEVDLDSVGSKIAGEYERAVLDKAPVYGHWDFVKHSGRTVEYRRLILPLSGDGKTIDMLLCCAVTMKAY